MTITRRSFLGTVAAYSSVLPWAGFARSSFGRRFARPQFELSSIVLADLQGSCRLPESLAGYEFGLKAIGAEYQRVPADSIPFCPLIIVPGLASGGTGITRRIRDVAESGSSILIESGALFHDLSEFEDHRRMLRSHFSIDAEPPVALWEHRGAQSLSRLDLSASSTPGQPAAGAIGSLPYIDYLWPFETKIRDFSSAIPVSSENGEVVAVSPGGVPVAVRRRLGLGSVIFLGSPVGPAILSGDREARKWLHAVVEFSLLTPPPEPLGQRRLLVGGHRPEWRSQPALNRNICTMFCHTFARVAPLRSGSRPLDPEFFQPVLKRSKSHDRQLDSAPLDLGSDTL